MTLLITVPSFLPLMLFPHQQDRKPAKIPLGKKKRADSHQVLRGTTLPVASAFPLRSCVEGLPLSHPTPIQLRKGTRSESIVNGLEVAQ